MNEVLESRRKEQSSAEEILVVPINLILHRYIKLQRVNVQSVMALVKLPSVRKMVLILR